MQVLMLRNPRADLGCKLKEGEIGEVSDLLAKELIGLRIAQEHTKKEPEILGVAKAPKIAKAEKHTKPKDTEFE